MSIIFSQTLSNHNTGNQSVATRQVIPTLSGASLGQVRVTFQAGTSAGLKATHCSIAVVGAATIPNTTLTPTELLFSGVSGFNLATSGQITSDWVNFSCLSTDTLIVCIDEDSSGNGDGGDGALQGTVTGAQWWAKPSSSSYNQATVSGFSQIGTLNLYVVNLIETQASGGGGTDDRAFQNSITSIIHW